MYPVQTVTPANSTSVFRFFPAGTWINDPTVPMVTPSFVTDPGADAHTWTLGTNGTLPVFLTRPDNGHIGLLFTLDIRHDTLTSLGMERYTPYAGNTFFTMTLVQAGGPQNFTDFLQFEVPPGDPASGNPVWMNAGALSLFGALGAGPFSDTQLATLASWAWQNTVNIQTAFEGRSYGVSATIYIPDSQGGPHLRINTAVANVPTIPAL